MKHIIKITLFIIAILVVSGLMGFIYFEQANQPVNKIEVNIGRETPNGFFTEEAVRNLIPQEDSLQFRKVKEIKTGLIEDALNANPFIEKSDVFINIDKNIVININEKNPVLRIFNKKNTGYYIDEKGIIFPLSNQYTAHVMIVSGHIDVPHLPGINDIMDSTYASTALSDIFELSELIRKNEFLSAQISQIYINSKGEFDLIPELGDHLIRFGKMELAKTKLNNLEIFYKKALVKEGWDKYAVINLKYKDQVVCEKK